MDIYHGHKERKALRQEARHERKEARLHGRAVNAAVHGNVVKAARLEMRANNAHHRAEDAHYRAEGHHAATHNPRHTHCCTTKCRPCCGNRVTVVHHQYHTDPVPETYPCGTMAPPASYPTGTVPPPPTTYPTGTVPPPQQQPVVYPYPQTEYPNPQAPAYPYPAEPPPPYSGYPPEANYPYPTK